MKSRYNTKQKKELIAFLERCPTHLTVRDVFHYFQKNSVGISQTTVYRQLEQLVAEGVVNKYIVGPGSPACFEYNDGKEEGEEITITGVFTAENKDGVNYCFVKDAVID